GGRGKGGGKGGGGGGGWEKGGATMGTPAARAVVMSLPESPTMSVRSSVPPARWTVLRKISGLGFRMPNVSWPHTARKWCERSSASSTLTASHSSLLVQMAKRKPFAARLSSAHSAAGKGRERSAIWAA